MTITESDVAVNVQELVSLLAHQVEEYNRYQGRGFRVEGRTRIVESGAEYEMMKEKYSLEITSVVDKQLL